MSNTNVVPIQGGREVAPIEQEKPQSDWERLTEKKREKAMLIQTFIKPALDRVAQGVKPRPAAEYLYAKLSTGHFPDSLVEIGKQLGRGGKIPSWQTINRWLKDYGERGIMGLVPKHKGSTRQTLGCEARILHYLRMGSKNNPGNIAKILQQEGWDVTAAQVRRFINSLPSNEGMNNPGRLGALAYDSTMKSYTRRKTDHLPVGACYQSDGNMMPIYLQHPTGNRPARFEMTPVIDVRSRYVSGYYLSESESAESTLHALTDSIVKEDHVPIDFQADNGAGFKNKRVRRFFDKLGIYEAHPRPRNPKDNGYIERWHAIMKDELLKQFPAYCGKDAAPEKLEAYLKKVDKGEARLMSKEQFIERMDEYIYWYNHKRKHGELGNRTPAELWQALKKNPPVDIENAFYWDDVIRTVGRSAIRFATREYYAPELIQYNKRKVMIEYNPYNDDFIKVRTLDERWICDAKKINESPYRSNSVIEDRAKKSLEKKRKRVLLKLEEVDARGVSAITHDQTVDKLLDFNTDNLLDIKKGTALAEAAPDTPVSDSSDKDELDIFDTDY